MSCCSESNKPDYLLRCLALAWLVCCVVYFSGLGGEGILNFCKNVYQPMAHSWWALLLGIASLGLLNRLPREFVVYALGNNKAGKAPSLWRAMLAGVLLDLCNHGILMVASKLYQRGASLGQTMAFLIASPWNSMSVFLVLASFIGWSYALLFLLLSLLVALLVGLGVDRVFVPYAKQTQLASVPNADFKFWQQARQRFALARFDAAWWKDTLLQACLDSRMVLRWLLLGCFIVAGLHVLIGEQGWQQWFAADFKGLLATLGLATVLEVCSEGSLPVANDIFHHAGAVGNTFCFLMAGACTDLTEILVLRSCTKRWSAALLLPLLAVPVVLVLAMLLNLLPLN